MDDPSQFAPEILHSVAKCFNLSFSQKPLPVLAQVCLREQVPVHVSGHQGVAPFDCGIFEILSRRHKKVGTFEVA